MVVDIYLRKGTRKDGKNTLCLRATHQRKTKLRSLKIYVKDNEFKNGKITKTHENYIRINALLHNKLNFYQNKILEHQSNNIEFDINTFLLQEETDNFFDEVDRFMQKHKKLITNSTIETTQTALKAFRKYNANITFRQIKDKTFQEFYNFLLTEFKTIHDKHPKEITCFKYVQMMSALYNYLAKKHEVPVRRLSLQRRHKQTKEPIFLTKDELSFIYNYYFSEDNKLTESQNNTLKMFLFSCFTGLRYSDVQTFHKELHIQNGKISMVMLKVLEKVTIPVTPYTQKILDQPRWDNRKNNTLNKSVKVLFKNLNFPEYEKYSFHVARHTFATTCLTNGMNLKTVSKLLGHSSIRNTEIYAQVVEQLLEEEMDKFSL